MKKLLITLLLGIALMGLITPTLSHAAADEKFNVGILRAEGQQQDYLFNPHTANQTANPVVAVIFKAIDLLTKTIGSLAVGTLILSGLWLVTSHGEQTQIDKGKKIFTYAIVGVVFAFMSYIIATLVQGFFK
ncbi:MAG: hypothetical protein WCT36_04345 [Candidatus Gracilibacteria bacterium]|jgi:hypothetical protein